jgi:hypothetical protein
VVPSLPPIDLAALEENKKVRRPLYVPANLLVQIEWTVDCSLTFPKSSTNESTFQDLVGTWAEQQALFHYQRTDSHHAVVDMNTTGDFIYDLLVRGQAVEVKWAPRPVYVNNIPNITSRVPVVRVTTSYQQISTVANGNGWFVVIVTSNHCSRLRVHRMFRLSVDDLKRIYNEQLGCCRNWPNFV